MTPRLPTVAAIALFALASAARAAEPPSDKDRLFVDKVSQGGAYEVEASKLAAARATAADVRDQAATEVHDHEAVNRNLKRIADAAGVAIAPQLNKEFKARLLKLSDVPAAEFDAAYLKDMDQIHAKDEKLFAKEAEEGTGDFRAFAAETDKIVKRHIGALKASD